MKRIPLTHGQFALVDDEDFDKFGKFKWYAFKHPSGFYAIRTIQDGTRRKTIYLHRQIMGEPIGMEVDHRNHNTLDDRKYNFRICTHAQNARHRKGAQKSSESGIRGVGWKKSLKKWHARITYNGKRIHLGFFNNKTTASRVYAIANRKYFGEFGGVVK